MVSRNPRLWRRIELRNERISETFLVTLSKRCSKLRCLILEDLRARKRKKSETVQDYVDSTSCCLESGLEQILKKSEASLINICIINCGNTLSSKCLWVASCYSRMLRHVTYISDVYPVGPEVLWALGSGCRDLETLVVPPLFPCQKPAVFNTKCVQLIGQCFCDLEILCIGGVYAEHSALAVIAKNCKRLKSLELNHMAIVTMATAVGMCDKGLKNLQEIHFISTPVEMGAVQIFYDTCKHLKKVIVHLSRADFTEGTIHLENKRCFEDEMRRLKDLLMKPGLGNILQIKEQITKADPGPV